MSDIAMIGDIDSILGFKGLGIKTFPVQSNIQVKELIAEIIKENYKIIYITENYAEGIIEFVHEIHNELWPLIVLIPSIHGTFGRGKERLRQFIIKATGSDLIGK